MISTSGATMALAFGGRSVGDLAIDHRVEVDPRSGAAQLRVPVPAPSGRGGLAPELTLVYSSGAGNSVVGAGWALAGLPAITLDTRYHVPRWDGSDGYQLSGDELVPWLEQVGGQWQPRGYTHGRYSIALLRSRRGSGKVRVEKWVDTTTGRVHFRTRDPGNTVTIFGARPVAAARIADPDDESRTLAWLPEVQVDAHGNALWFEYAPETADGVDRTAPCERRRLPLAQRYLKRVRYGNVSPLALDDAVVDGTLPPGTRFCFQLVLDYGDHASADAPAAEPDQPWPSRLDPFTSSRNGFEIRTYRLCRRILSFHQFDELGPAPSLTRALVLAHAEDAAGSTLTGVTEIGYRTDAGVRTARALPPLRLTYAPAATASAFADAPVTARENVPAGFATQRCSFVDLFGEGLAGILVESDRTWFYKPNRGGGEFGAQTMVLERPATRGVAWGFGDVDGDGDTDLSQRGGRLAGLFERDRDEEVWRGFRPFAEFPHVEALGGRAQWVDLNGDGRADLVVAKGDSFVWFASDGESFLPPVELPRPAGVDAVPTVNADLALDFFFADMTGDGLADLVRVRNGQVTYWPSLGNGRFGDAVVMDGAPRFDDDDRFDGSRVRFVDLDGSGTSDLVYVGPGEVRCFINASGNQLVPGPQLAGLPYLDNASTARILDFLGDGRACLVWSTPLPGRQSALEYLPLTPRDTPRLLLSVDNSRGQVTNLRYSSSASHYLRDVASGRGWSTRMPIHHPVVDEREQVDEIGGTRSLQRFAYHDGVYDGVERESRGFGQVDVYDGLTADGTVAGPGAAGFAPPVLTRTWFHVGNAMWSTDRLRDAYAGDSALPTLPPHVIDDESTLTDDEIEDGLRALAGGIIRREVFAVDGDGLAAAHPFTAEQTTLRLRRLQPAGRDCGAAFSVLTAERARWSYEQEAGDPRVEHQLLVDSDDDDLPRRTVTIGYARRTGIARDVAAQDRHLVEVHDLRLLSFDQPDRYELGLPIEARRYELAGLRPGPGGLLTLAALRDPAVVAALASPGPSHVDLADDPALGPQARLLAWEQSYYWDDARAAALPLGAIGSATLVHHEEAACFAPELVADALQGKVDDATLSGAGYVQHDGLWWVVDAQHLFAPPSQFSQRIGLRRSDGAATQLAFDAYALFVTSSVDPLGNAVTGEIDYQQLAPWRLTDGNGNRSEVRYDALGVVVAATSYGHIGTADWGFDPLSAVASRAPATLADALANPGFYLQGASRFVWYDLDAWKRDGTPTVALALVREELVHDGSDAAPPAGRVQVGVSYLDGFGRVLQEKLRTDAGPAIQRAGDGSVVVDAGGQPILAPSDPRWRASGHVVYDAKQQPGRRFEPFFTPSPQYEGDLVLQQFGVATLVRYDALGRTVGNEYPDGTFSTVRYRAWSVERADANDNVLGSAWAAARSGRPPDDPERQAYEEAVPHAGTTSFSFFDPLGREAGQLARGGAGTADRRVESRLDVEGQARAVVDARGLVAITARFDMQGRTLVTSSIDAGTRWTFSDAWDRELLAWDARGFVVTRAFDGGDRPLWEQVNGGDGDTPLDHRVHEWVYGESLPDRADAQRRNLLGRVAIVRDGASETQLEAYDPVGRGVGATRRLRQVIDAEPDWRGPVPLESESYRVASRFNGVGHLVADTLADGTTRAFEYLAAGRIARVRVTTPDGALQDVTMLDGVTAGARGERLTATLGNGVALGWTYDERSLRLQTQTARLGGRALQDLAYTFDPAGNITRITDAAQEGANAIIGGVQVTARRDFRYDAHYRLTQASGRVHQALLQNDFVPSAAPKRHLSLNNGAAVERYTRNYVYDAASNLQSIQHVGASHAWTTDLWISPTSNRSLPALDLNGNPIAAPESKFDAAGNLRELSHLRAMSWSWRGALERAVVIARPGGVDDGERYVYGRDLQRVRKVTTRLGPGGVVETTEKVYFGDVERKRVTVGTQQVLERWTVHVVDGEQRIALVHRWTTDTQGREVSDPSRPQIRYQLSTHQGSSALELDETGRIISYEEYFPYAGTAFIAGDDVREVDVKEYRYSTKECDDFTGLYYYGYRYLASWMGRWLSPDPSGPEDDLNLYQFVLGDPVGHVDADGRDTTTPQPGEIVYHNHRPPAPADSIEGKIASFRASIGKNYRVGFDSLSHDDQVRAVTTNDVWLVPKDPRAETGTTGWALISGDEYRNKWLPARQEWATAKKQHVNVELMSQNPNAIIVDRSAVPPPQPPPDAPNKPPSDDSTGSKQKADKPGKDGKSPKAADDGATTGNDKDGDGEGGGKGHGGKGHGKSKHKGGKGGGDGTGEGDGVGPGKLHSTSNLESDVYGDEFGGQRGGREGGQLGGTPFSRGHTAGGMGDAPTGPLGTSGHGAAGSGHGPSQSLAGVGAPGPSQPSKGAPSGNGDNREHTHGPPGSAAHGQTSPGADGARGQGNSGAKQDAQDGAGHPYGWKNVLLDVAGMMNFVFSEEEGGDPLGVPGGLGWLHLKGEWLQWLYITTSVVSFIDLVANLPKLLAGLVNLGKGLLRLGWKFLTELPNMLRLGWRAFLRLGEGFSWAGRGFLTAIRWSTGFVNKRGAILAAFRAAEHTPVSRLVLDAIESGQLKVAFRATLDTAGKAVSATKIFVNSSMHLEDVLATIVHEGQHALDIRNAVIPLARNAGPAEVAFAELRAWWSAIRFAEHNQFAASKLAALYRTWPKELLLDLIDSYKIEGAPLSKHLTKDHVDAILDALKEWF